MTSSYLRRPLRAARPVGGCFPESPVRWGTQYQVLQPLVSVLSYAVVLLDGVAFNGGSSPWRPPARPECRRRSGEASPSGGTVPKADAIPARSVALVLAFPLQVIAPCAISPRLTVPDPCARMVLWVDPFQRRGGLALILGLPVGGSTLIARSTLALKAVHAKISGDRDRRSASRSLSWPCGGQSGGLRPQRHADLVPTSTVLACVHGHR